MSAATRHEFYTQPKEVVEAKSIAMRLIEFLRGEAIEFHKVLGMLTDLSREAYSRGFESGRTEALRQVRLGKHTSPIVVEPE